MYAPPRLDLAHPVRVNLYSDTQTKPTRAMREAMMAADEDQRRRWAENGAAHVLENYTYKASATRFERMLDEVSEAHHGR